MSVCACMCVCMCVCVSNFDCLEEGKKLEKAMQGDDSHASEMIRHFSACHSNLVSTRQEDISFETKFQIGP